MTAPPPLPPAAAHPPPPTRLHLLRLRLHVDASEQAGSCFVKYPWIPKALDTFYVHAWAAANASTDSPAEAMERLRKTMWGK